MSNQHDTLATLMHSDSDALLELLNFCFPEKSQKPSKLNLQQTLTLLKTADLNQHSNLITAVERQLEPLDCLAQDIYAQLRYSEQLLINYHQGHKLPTAIQQAMTPLLPMVAEVQLQNPKWVWQQHPLIDLLSLIQQHCIGWHDDDSKISARFLNQFTTALQTLHQQWQQGKLDFAKGDFEQNALSVFFAQESKRSNKLEQRVKDAERGALKAKRAQDLSTRIINNKMEGKLLPSAIIQFLQSSWHDSVILQLIQSDNIQAESHRLGKLTETLIWTFQPFDQADNETQQRIYRLIANLQKEYASATVSLKHQPEKLEQVLATIETEHLKILKGEAIIAADFTPLATDDLLAAANTKISGSLLKKVNLIREGQWFSHLVDKQPRAIKLLLKLSDSQQLLFSNHAGMKACQYSFDELAYKLSNSSIRPLPDTCRIEQTAAILIENLFKIQQKQQQKQASIEQAQQQEQQALEEKRRLDRQKALDEAKALQAQREEHKKQQALAREQEIKPAVEQPELSFSEQQQYSLQLHQLAVGGTVRFFRSGSPRDCKLAAITQQANKYIFVNREGIKDCEILKQELITQLATQQAEIVHQGDKFEDALSKVVSSIRKKK